MADIKNFFQKNRICPTCAVKRIVNGVRLNNQVREKYDVGAVRDIWNKTDFTTSGKISEKLGGHSVLLYRIKAE